MPDYIPKEFGQPNKISGYEEEFREWRRAYPRRTYEPKREKINTACRLRRSGGLTRSVHS
jgi:hypothetical protein